MINVQMERSLLHSDFPNPTVDEFKAPTGILPKTVSNGNSGVIKPFHALKSPGNKWPRPSSQSLPRAACVGANNHYGRVRRRSPLCHDVLESMLDGASVSSRESLPLGGVSETIGSTRESAPKPHDLRNNISAGLLSSRNASKRSEQCVPDSRIYTRLESMHSLSIDIDTNSVGRAEAIELIATKDDIVNGSKSRKGKDTASSSNNRNTNSYGDDHDDDDDSSYSGWSDEGPDGGSDEGFDGRCHTPPSATGGSPQSTAGCSRASSKKSSRSSELSDSSTAADLSPKWWKKRFRPSKRKSLDSHCSSPEDPDNSLLSDSSKLLVAKSNASLMPMLTKLKRSVSSRSARKSEPMRPIERNTVSATSASRIVRAKSLAKRPTTSESTLDNVYQKMEVISKTKVSSVALETDGTSGNGNDNDNDNGIFKAQWVLLKCKGMVNLHVVTVPSSVSSLNHKDTFIFYPCVLCQPGNNSNPDIVDTTILSKRDKASESAIKSTTTSSSLIVKREQEQVQAGALLAQEYSRRKSVSSLASRVIYVWIGTHSSAIKRDAIMRVAMEIRDKELVGKAAILVIDESAASDIARRRFFSQLHNMEYGGKLSIPDGLAMVYNRISPLSAAGDDVDFERALERRKVVYGFWETVPPATILSVGADVNAALLLKVPVGGVIVLDTWTDVFVWWRNEPNNPAVRQCALNFSRMLIRDTCIPQRPRSASVWTEVRGFEHVIFKTKFPDWPYIFASSMGTTSVVCHNVPAVGTIAPPAAVPIRSISRASTRAVAVA